MSADLGLRDHLDAGTPYRSRNWVHVRHLATILLVLTTLVAATACSERTEAWTAPSSTSIAGAASDRWTAVPTQDAQPFASSTDRLPLRYRQLKRRGSWQVSDMTDRIGLLRKNVGGLDELWLMDISTMRMKRALATATTSGWWIGGDAVSNGWLAWEELSPGDDLVIDVEWRLFAAPVQLSTLTIGEPLLIASASTANGSRPLFDLSGTTLAWISTVWKGSRDEGREPVRSQLTAVELPHGQAREVYRAGSGMLNTVSLRGGTAVLSEVPVRESSWTRISLIGLKSGGRIAALRVPTEEPLSHWPAWRDGWLAWSVFQASEDTYPIMYLRTKAGRVHRSDDLAVDPCFVGPYMFYNYRHFNGLNKLDERCARAAPSRSEELRVGRR